MQYSHDPDAPLPKSTALHDAVRKKSAASETDKDEPQSAEFKKNAHFDSMAVYPKMFSFQ